MISCLPIGIRKWCAAGFGQPDKNAGRQLLVPCSGSEPQTTCPGYFLVWHTFCYAYLTGVRVTMHRVVGRTFTLPFWTVMQNFVSGLFPAYYSWLKWDSGAHARRVVKETKRVLWVCALGMWYIMEGPNKKICLCIDCSKRVVGHIVLITWHMWKTQTAEFCMRSKPSSIQMGSVRMTNSGAGRECLCFVVLEI